MINVLRFYHFILLSTIKKKTKRRKKKIIVMHFLGENCNGIQGYTVIEFHLKTELNSHETVAKVRGKKSIL